MEHSSIKISIVTVCYNAISTIEDTIQSVLKQTYENIEYIIIDGGSTDGTINIIKKYSNRLAYWISEPDKGIYDAMNKGIRVSSGDYINFMNSGDKFCNQECIANVIDEINVSKEVIYGDSFHIMHGNNKKYIKANKIDVITKRYPFCHQSTFTKTKYLKEHEFDITYKICADWNLFRKGYINDDLRFQYIAIPICDFDCQSGMSRDNLKLLYKERYRCLGIEGNILKTFPFEVLRCLVMIKKRIKKFIKNI